MNIELKNVSYNARLSEETSCFSAAVYIDGKKEGTVANRGCGGCNEYWPHALEDKLQAHAKTLPPIEAEFSGKLDMDADLLIGQLLDDHLIAKDFDRAIKAKLLYVKPDGHLYEVKPKAPLTVQKYLDHRAEIPWMKDVTVLNTMARGEAIALYRKAGAA